MSEDRPSSERLNGAGLRVAVVVSRFNTDITEGLLEGARQCLEHHGVAAQDVAVRRVPGAWELPFALDRVAREGFDALVALGALIRGETVHFHYICAEASRGILDVSLQRGVPIGFGLLTCEKRRHAVERSGGGRGNKGWEAAEAALEMALGFGSTAETAGDR